jgi:hypothetical protein
LNLPFFFKFDATSDKPAREAELIRELRADVRLPERCRRSLPEIFAIEDGVPSGYLAERLPVAYQSFETLLFPPPGSAPPSTLAVLRWTEALLDLIFAFNEARIDRHNPVAPTPLLARIRTTLEAAAAADPRWVSRPLIVNGRAIDGWAAMLARIESRSALLKALQAPFRTWHHGDLNPGNAMLAAAASGVVVKLIDPALDRSGCWARDLARLNQFVSTMVPFQKPGRSRSRARFDLGQAEISFQVPRPPWLAPLLEAIRLRCEGFAEQHGDHHWRLRWALAHAADLLGRVGRAPAGAAWGPRELAVLQYGQGLLWLDELNAAVEARFD